MKDVISLEELQLYFTGQKKHKCYVDTKTLYDVLKTHADGLLPTKLIEERRPSEGDEVLEYRKKIYVPMTKNPIGKVLTSLSKIRRSPDWSIKYDTKKFPSRIVEEERPDKYTEDQYPEHDSVTNWVFSHLLKNYCIDANAVVLVMPNNIGAEKVNEYYKPVATVFNSDQVLFYEDDGEYAILQSTDASDLIKDDGTTSYQTGKVFIVVTKIGYYRFEESKEGSFSLTRELIHNKGKLPVFKIKAPFLKQKDNSTIQESRLSPMLWALDEAAREYSDLQASKVQHMFPLFWYFQNKECNKCNGIGKTTEENGSKECTSCGGSGKVKFSPYAHLELTPASLAQQAVPAPPAGYVQRDVEIIKHQDSSIDKLIYKSLASINMQFLDQTPLNISGEAKSIDKDELNNFVHSIAEDLVAVMDKIYWWIIEWRYAVIVPDQKARFAMLPKIAVPEKFDILPADYMMDEIGKAKTSKVNPLLVATMEQDYANKKFYNNPDLASLIDCYYELDPLPGYSVDEKMSLLQNKGCTQEDFVISNYITSFVRRAKSEHQDFLAKNFSEKMVIIKSYADEKIKASDKAEQAKQELLKEQQQAFQQQQ